MADDPNRDLLPVKEGCRQVCGPQKLKPTNTISIPSYSNFGEDSKDLQQRHYVTKLDRDELEDRFLRMMEDHTQMKKKCNSQEEKIKRLATKLLRIVSDRDRALKSASDRREHHAVDRLDEMQARVNDLENCNQQLQERVMVLKTQLGAHSKLHASVHYNGNAQSPSRSGRSRPCSQTGLIPEQDTMVKRGSDSWDQQGESKGSSDEEALRRKVTHLEQEIASMQEQHRAKILQLEQQISYLSAEEQRHRAAENIEIIRLKREMKTQAMQMEAVKAQSNGSEMELQRVRCELQDCQSDNCNLSRELRDIKTSNADLMEQLTDARGVSENSRELMNQVSDLQREQHALKTQNNQLLEIASKTICSKECASESPDGRFYGYNNISSSHARNSAPNDEELQDMYNEMQKIRDLSASQEFYNDTRTGIDPRNMKEYCTGELDFGENNLLKEPSSTLLLEPKDSHTRTHNRLCTCDIKNRKSFYPPCPCGCSLCTQAQLSKKDVEDKTYAMRSHGTELKSPLSDDISEHYVRQLDLASGNNNYSSREEILAGAPCSSGKQIGSRSPEGEQSKEYGARSGSVRTGGSLSSSGKQRGCGSPEAERNKDGVRSGSVKTEGSLSSSGKRRGSRSPEGEQSKDGARSGSVRTGGSTSSKQSAGSKSPEGGTSKGSGAGRAGGSLSPSGKQSGGSKSPEGGASKGSGAGRAGGSLSSSGKQSAASKSPGGEASKGSGAGRAGGSLSSSGKQSAGSKSPEGEASKGSGAGSAGGSIKSLEDKCDKECTDVCSKHKVEARHEAGSPTLTGQQEPSGYNSNRRSTTEGVPQDQKGYKPPLATILLPTKDKSGSKTSMPGNTSATNINQADILHELEVCKELLRVQCSLNASFKNELTKLYAEIAKLEGSSSSLSNTLSNNPSPEQSNQKQSTRQATINQLKATTAIPSQDGMRRKSLLRIGDGEGLFEIHAHCIELSEEGSAQIPAGRGMFLTWAFYDQDVAYTPLKMGPKAEINTSAVYRVLVNDTFLEHLHTELCYIDLHASKDDSSELVARGSLKFSEILDFPQNKLHSSIRLSSVKPCEVGRTLGMLQCWFRLSCELSIIDKFNEGRTRSPKSYDSPAISETDAVQPIVQESQIIISRETSSDNIQSGSESASIQMDAEASPMNSAEEVHSSSTKNSSVSSAPHSKEQSAESVGSTEQMMNDEIREEIYHSAENNLDVANSKTSNATELQMLEILDEDNWDSKVKVSEDSVDTIEASQEDKMQREIMARLDKVAIEQKSLGSLESELDIKIDGPLVLTVEIHSFTPDLTLEFYQKSKITQLYVEFKFLGMSGPELETKSAPIKSGTLLFNYKKSFNYSAADQQKMLADMYQGATWHDNALQFVIVSEPQENENTDLDCEEIGFADVDLKQLISKGRDFVKSDVVVYGADGKSTDLGKLNVSILGMKTCHKAVKTYLKNRLDQV